MDSVRWLALQSKSTAKIGPQMGVLSEEELRFPAASASPALQPFSTLLAATMSSKLMINHQSKKKAELVTIAIQ
jgi:hypothetical protein